MEANEYQQLALRTAKEKASFIDRLGNAAMGIAGEAGELANKAKKHIYHHHPLDRKAILEELGDVLWYAAETCTLLDVGLSDVMAANIEKLRIRYPEGFSEERSLNRPEGN